jgi:hypothetical protein
MWACMKKSYFIYLMIWFSFMSFMAGGFVERLLFTSNPPRQSPTQEQYGEIMLKVPRSEKEAHKQLLANRAQYGLLLEQEKYFEKQDKKKGIKK